MKQSKVTGTVLKVTDVQLKSILEETFDEMVEEIPRGLFPQFCDAVMKKAKATNEENCLYWGEVLKELEKQKENHK